MSDPFNYPFLKKDNTMYLSTICKYSPIQPNRTSIPSSNPSTASPPFSNMTSQAPRQRFSFLRVPPLPISYSPPMSNLPLIAASTSIKLPIPYSWQTSTAQDQKQYSSELSVTLILSVPSTPFLLLLKSFLIMAAISSETRFRSAILMENAATLGKIEARKYLGIR